MPCSGPLGANLSSSSHGSKGAWGTFVHLGEGGKPDHGREHWLGVGGWVFAIPQLLTLNLSFHHPETVTPTSLRGMVHNIPWDDTCVQSVLHPSVISNACGFSWPPRVWHSRVGIYTCHLEPEILLSLSWRCLGLVWWWWGGAYNFQAYGVACPPPWQGCQRGPPFCIPVV